MPKILISACLLGEKVRYDGNGFAPSHARLQELIASGDILSICPEVAGGLPVPRPPAEIQGGHTGDDVLVGKAKLLTNTGLDVSEQLIEGAKRALALAQKHNIKVAILKARSPSCGSLEIYDGSFSGMQISGMGVTAALLSQHGIHVYDEEHIDEALDAFDRAHTPA